MTDFEKELDLVNGKIYLVAATSAAFSNKKIELMKFLANKKKMKSIYVTIDKPYKTIHEEFQKNKINESSIFFIDVITKGVKEVENVSNCLFLESPYSLTALSLAIQKLIDYHAAHEINLKEVAIIFDSLSSLHQYIKIDELMRFMHSILNKARMNELYAFIFLIEGEISREKMAPLQAFCDKEIKIG